MEKNPLMKEEESFISIKHCLSNQNLQKSLKVESVDKYSYAETIEEEEPLSLTRKRNRNDQTSFD